jgi:transposase-like protein
LGKQLKLVVTNGNPALLEVFKTIYPFVKRQRCIAYRMRNVAVKIRKINRHHCLKEAKLIFNADNRKEAIKRLKSCGSKWIVEEKRAVQPPPILRL